ncbi:MAG TPA: hypothetical protein VK177_16485, partial [Flavobacteriales bacterium]|nr:hypothetical protein [Flavobacteriales bacterium]
RVVRSDYSYVYDAGTATTSDGYDIGVELGTGGLFKVGGDLTVTANNSTSGMWDEENNTKSYLKAHASTSTRGYEKFYFKEANEKTIEGDEFYSTFGSNKAARVELQDNGDFNVVAGNRLQLSSGGYVNLPASNTRSKREKRNQVMYALTKYEVANGAGIEPLLTGSYAQTSAPNHHIAEIITYSNDGSRYVYGLPAYNTSQKDITFAVGARLNANDGATGDCSTGLVPYNTSDNSLSNDRGIDNYYSATTTPAYAHSYLLTSVLSAEYIDSDGQQGPTDHDLGYYTKFYYERISGYKWRTPYTASTNEAGYNEGIKTDANDDKANIIYGEKEIYYLDSIVTKNYIAIFHKSNRQDGYEAAGENGGVGTKTMKKLDKISLYSRWDYRRNPATAVPLKEVHFVYDYSLCDGVPNNPTGGGKLTLKEIYFTYQNSQKAKFSAYEFEYNGLNPNYAFKANDRWGNYKAIPGGAGCGNTGNLAPAEFPYVIQDSSVTNDYVSAWLMTDINLPSGGKIHVQYESDDYAYVQNKKASQMFRIEGYQGQSFPSSETDARNITAPGKRIYFALQDDITDMSKYFGGMERVYFRFLMETNSGHHDYVSGYFNIASYGTHDTLGETYGYVIPQSVDINDAAASADVNPITKAAVQYCRLNLPRHIYDQPAIDDGDSFGEDLLNSLVSVVSNFSAAVQGENKWILTKGKCEDAILKKSWIRLYNPTAKKLGGGVRVKKIVMSDEWANMTDSTMSSANYGQEYEYTLEDGTSSGVAAWEPQLGGDENTWKQPIFTNEKNLLAPDTEHYVEEPFGEGFFPGASVGYSRVTVKNLARSGVTKHATGKVVHEFFTAKNFPTIVENTKVKSIQDKTDPFSIASMFYVKSKDFMNASQGFYIELNDMHGKEKKQSVYQEGKTDPITSVEYKYKTDPYLTGSYRLNNNMKVVEPDGSISNKNIGLVMDMLTDFRQQRTELNSAATMCNLDGFIWPFPPTPIAIPVFLPSITHEVTQFRSAVVTKVVQRFGILEETIAKDLGSIVSTKNIAWDSETGEVLLTQTKTDFNDAIYSMSYPAHWYYDNMGQAYKNIGLTQAAVTFTAGNASISNANQYFTPGDVLQLKNGSTFILVWVVSTTSSGISVVKKDGSTFSGSYSFKIIRSGRKNLQSTPIATITSLSNPLTNFNANVYDKVLQASAVEFSDRWRTFCDCFDEPTSPMTYTNNPYILGTRGNWRMKTSFLHLSPRTQSMYNNNTNIRKDGTFVSFTPYYRLNTGKWQVDEKNWTYTSSVTEYSPYGQELENQDALGRYSTATFGYRQSFATAVAANSRYRDLGFDNFEDYGFSKCADNHFKFNVVNHIVDDDSHSGRRSIQISQGQPLTMKKVLTVCDPAGCSIEITTSAITNGKQAVVSGGDEPYQVDWNVINGAPVVSFSGTNFNALNITGPGSKIELIILDAKGCKLTKQINL